MRKTEEERTPRNIGEIACLSKRRRGRPRMHRRDEFERDIKKLYIAN